MAKTGLFIFLILLGLLGAQSPLLPLAAYKVIVLLAGAAILFFVLSLTEWKQRDTGLVRLTPLSVLFLLFCAWTALGYLYSADPEKSLLLTVQALGASLLYLGLVVYVRNDRQVERLVWILLLFGGMIALVGILQQFPLAFLKNPIFHTSDSTSLFVHRNVFAGYLVMLIPLACWVYFTASAKLWRTVAGVSFVLLLAALGFSGSRGGMLVVFLILPVILGYLLFSKNRKGALNLVQGIAISIGVYFVIDMVLTLAGIEVARTSLGQLTHGTVAGRAQSLNRILFWQGAWEIFKDHWLIGSGPLSFSSLFPQYFLHVSNPLVNSSYLMEPPPHAHNIFIQTASDSGLIGIGLMLAFLGVFYYRGHKLFWHSVPEIRPGVFFITLAITAFLMDHMLEYNWPGSMFIYHFTILIFLMDFTDRKFSSAAESKPIWKRAAFLIPGAGIVLVFFTLLSAANYYRYQNTLYEQFPRSTSLDEFKTLAARAKQICPRCERIHIKMAESLFEHYKTSPSAKLLNDAEKELREGIRLSPHNPALLAHLGQIRAIQGDYGQALTLFKQALKYNKTHVIARMGLSAMGMERMHRVDQAGVGKP
ncbi:MAG: O-antigen ligase family protein [Nitrospinae bacterium]|nr:O-antigen ligase family protein [Nitrospinota bacterium]